MRTKPMDIYNKPPLSVYLRHYSKPSLDEYLKHHGIEGQKWGERRGPPYPLSTEQKKGSEKSVASSKIEQYNNLINNLIHVDAVGVFETAKSGGRHKGVYADAIKKKRATLEKSIA